MIAPDDELFLIIESFRWSRDLLAEAIAGLSEHKMGEPALDGWSVKDHLSHLAQWHELRYLDLQRLAAGQQSAIKSTPEQEQLFNQMTVEWRRHLSLGQVLWELDTSRQRVLDAIDALTQEQWGLVLARDWPLKTGHDAQHATWIKAWRGLS